MQRYIDNETGFEWHFDDHIDPFHFPHTPKHLQLLDNKIIKKNKRYKQFLHKVIELLP
jgi:hypothetical protein